MKDNNRVEIWLNKALELENRGFDFYLDASEKAGDPQARDFFKYLSDQEKIHINIIKKIFGNLTSDTCWANHPAHQADEKTLNQIFLKMSKNKPSKDAGIIKAIDNGIMFETEAMNFYKDEITRAGCDDEKKFLTALAAEENDHRQQLEDLKLYYSDPEAWQERMDHGHLDGV